EHRILEHTHRKRQSVTRGSPRPPGGCHGANLAGPDREPPSMERATKGHPRLRCPVPGELDQLGLIAEQLQAAGKARLGGRAMKNKIIVASSIIGMHQLDTQACRKTGPGGVHVHELEPVDWKSPTQGSAHS